MGVNSSENILNSQNLNPESKHKQEEKLTLGSLAIAPSTTWVTINFSFTEVWFREWYVSEWVTMRDE